MYNKIKIPSDYFEKNLVDYENYFQNDDAINLITNFLNNFSNHVDEELDFHYDFDRYNIIISLVRPITEKEFIKFKLRFKNNSLKFFVIFNEKIFEINGELFNCIIAYLVCSGMVYSYELNSIIKKS